MIPPGTPIAVLAPSHAYDADKLAGGLKVARARGHDLHPFPQLTPHRYFAGTHEARLEQLVTALSDDAYGAVWMVRGGSGMMQLLGRIPWHRVQPKPVIGFSDIVALHLALAPRGLGPCVHGPVVHALPVTDEASVDHLFALIEGREVPPMPGEPWVPGTVTAPVVGGNLRMLASTCGTPYQLDAHGAIVVLEDIGEAAYKVDRALQQLVSAGVLDGVAGLAIGTFDGVDPDTMREVVLEHAAPMGVPVVGSLPIGHGPANRAFVWGRPATLIDGALRLGS